MAAVVLIISCHASSSPTSIDSLYALSNAIHMKCAHVSHTQDPSISKDKDWDAIHEAITPFHEISPLFHLIQNLLNPQYLGLIQTKIIMETRCQIATYLLMKACSSPSYSVTLFDHIQTTAIKDLHRTMKRLAKINSFVLASLSIHSPEPDYVLGLHAPLWVLVCALDSLDFIYTKSKFPVAHQAYHLLIMLSKNQPRRDHVMMALQSILHAHAF